MSLGEDPGCVDGPDASRADVKPSRGVAIPQTEVLECDEIDLFLESATPSDQNSTSERTTPDSVIIHNNHYIDLTEMEDDLANNNDPNNNAGDGREDANVALNEASNVLIVDDSEEDKEEEEEEPLANDDVGTIAVNTVEEIFKGLNNEVEKVKQLLVGVLVIPSDVEIYAYLEAHLLEGNRVQIVVEELSGTNDNSPVHSREASPVREMGENEPKGKSGKGTYRKGGKANAKGESEKVFGIRAISPELTLEVETVRPEKRPRAPENDEKVHKKMKSGDTQDSKSSIERRVKKPLSQPRKRQMNPADDANLLHGPFDFKAHRNGINSSAKSSSNIADHLIQSIQSVEKSHPKPILKASVLTTPATPPRSQSFKLKPATPLGVAQPPKDLQRTPPNRKLLVKPATPGHLNRMVPDFASTRKERAPSIEVIEVKDPLPLVPEIVEIIDNNPIPEEIPNEDVENFVKSFLEMVPDIDQDYLRARARDLVGHVAAIERFTLEILSDPTPPENWRQIYAAPFGVDRPDIVAVEPVPELVDITRDVELIVPDPVRKIDWAKYYKQTPPVEQAPIASTSTKTPTEVLPTPGPSIPDFLPVPASEEPCPGPSTSTGPEAKTGVLLEEVDPEMRWERQKEAYLADIFPDFSPEWLLEQIQSFRIASGTDDARFNVKVSEIMEMDSSKIPTKKEWEEKIKEQEELDKWSGNMTVKDMLELYEDDPAGHFHNPNRVLANQQLYNQHSRVGLMDGFRFTSIHVIDKMHKNAKFNYSMAFISLQRLQKSRKTKRPDTEIKYPADSCIEYLKEKKFVELESVIKEEKVRRENNRKAAFELARTTNSLMECKCCFEECLKEDMLPCKGGHLYCKECVNRGTNVAIGDGKTIIQCLGQCQEEIATRELQRALPPNVLSKLLAKRQAEEVGAADIDNLVTCPYCPYSTIMENEEDKVVVCRNPECGRDSCRLCRQPNHVPLRCEELESKDEEQARKRVEEALSDAIIRNCANSKCSARFMKTEGCNKMYCEKCKTTQCYLCKSVVKGYEHFYGQGGFPSKTKVCPLWSNNDELHASEVARAAQKETAELEKEGIKLKNNPMKDIKIPDKNGAPDNWRFPVDAPNLMEVIAPGAAREDVIRQQHQIEAMIRRGRPFGQGHFHPPHHLPGGPVAHGPPGPHMMQNYGDPNGFALRMGEILRLREQTRANARLVREREHQALMEFNRGWVGQPPMMGAMGGGGVPVAGQVAVAHVGLPQGPPQVGMPRVAGMGAPPVPAVQMPVEAPQAVPEPLQFADMAERHGRNIEVVDQRGMPQQRLQRVNHQRLFMQRDYRHLRRDAEEARRRERVARMAIGPHRGEEVRDRREERKRQRHEMILANLQESRRRLQRVEAEARLGGRRERPHPNVEARRARDPLQGERRAPWIPRPEAQAPAAPRLEVRVPREEGGGAREVMDNQQQREINQRARQEVRAAREAFDNHCQRVRERQDAREVVERARIDAREEVERAARQDPREGVEVRRQQVEEGRRPEENNAEREVEEGEIEEAPAVREGERQFDFQEILNLDNLNMDYNLDGIVMDDIIEF